MFAPSLISLALGSSSNPLLGATTTGGKWRSRRTINVKSKSAEETAGAPVKETDKNEINYSNCIIYEGEHTFSRV